MFLQVRFRGQEKRTISLSTPMPLWNESFVFDVFDADSEVSCTALQQSGSVITINIFDEVVAQKQETRGRCECGQGWLLGALPASGAGASSLVVTARFRQPASS